MKIMKISLVCILGLLLLLTACASEQVEPVSQVLNTQTLIETVTQTRQPSQTPAPSATETEEGRQTIIASQATKTAVIEQTEVVKNMTATVVALTPSLTPSWTFTQRPTGTPTMQSPAEATQEAAEATLEALEDLCDAYETDSGRSSEISPDGKWFAISCGYKRNQVLIVQNQGGIEWVFEFADFLTPDLEGIMGSLEPLAWSSDGRFLYFTKYLGRDGGGNQCFPGIGVYGLFRLHLRTGTLITLVPTDNRFSGDEIRFSPTLEYVAVDNDGVRIINLISDEVTVIDTSGVMEMSWSPDGRFLAYSVASCGEIYVESSSIYVWDSTQNQIEVLFTTEEMLLRPASWIDNSTLRFEGEKWVDNNDHYTIFEYDLVEGSMIFTGTATPRP